MEWNIMKQFCGRRNDSLKKVLKEDCNSNKRRAMPNERNQIELERKLRDLCLSQQESWGSLKKLHHDDAG